MTESFCRTVRTEPGESDDPPGRDPHRHASSTSNHDVVDRQRRPEVRSRHPRRAVPQRARRDRGQGRRRRRGRARHRRGRLRRDAPVAREGQARPHLGRASRKRSRRARSSRASSTAGSRAASPSTIDFVRAFLPGSLVDVRPVRDPRYLEGKTLEFKVIKLDQKRNNVVVSRRAVVEQEYSAERERAARQPAGRHGTSRASSRTSPTTARSSTSAASTACCTSPTWRGSASSIRPKSSTSATRSTCKHPEVRSRAQPRLARPEAARRGSVGRTSRAAIRRARACSARSRTSPTTAASWRSRKASKAWCTSPRWTGRTRTSIRPRSCTSATRSRSWCSTSTRSAAASRSASSSASRIRGREFARELQPRRQGQRPDQVDHRLRHVHRSAGRHRRPRAPVRHLLGRARRRSRAQLPEGRGVEAMVLAIDPERERISLGVKQLDKDPFSPFIAEHPKGSIVKGVVQEVDAQGRHRRPRRRHRRPAAGVRALARPRRGRAHGAQGRRRGRGQVHGRRSQDPHRSRCRSRRRKRTRKQRGGAELSLRRDRRRAPASATCSRSRSRRQLNRSGVQSVAR